MNSRSLETHSWTNKHYIAYMYIRPEEVLLTTQIFLQGQDQTDLYAGAVVGNPHDDGHDALVQQRHGRRAVDQTGQRVCQLLTQSRLKGAECTKL